ncbi:MAG: type IX secretion system membrane protein PorP/SprF [Sphingobacteriales bacterium]
MRRSLLVLILLISYATVVSAQQKPQYTQYVFNNFLLNPALSGIENYTDVKLGYRSQWTGLQGAPVTTFFTINTPIGSNFINGDASELPTAGGEYPGSRSYLQNYQAAEPHHGIGFTLVNDKAGPITATNINATYAYHIGLTSTLNLALGVAAGVAHTSLNTSLLTTTIPDDPAIDDASGGVWSPDLSVGVWAYSSNYYVGASVQQVLPEKLYADSRNTVYQNKTVPQYFFTAGYKFFVSDDISIMPSIMLKEINPVPFTFDVNAKISFRDIFWLGGSYRKDDSFGILAGFNINSTINVGYSYDMTTSALNTVSNGTHEIVLGILLNNKYQVTCPRHSF